MSGPAVKEPMTTGKERLQVAKYFRALRFDERTHLGLGDIRLTMGQQEDLIAEYEALVREREEAERKLADALQSVQSWQMEVLGRDSDIEQLRALLDEAQRDAARYRWLRDVWWLGEYFDTPDPVTQANSADEFDAAIDEARILRAGETK